MSYIVALQSIRMNVKTVISILMICSLWSCKLDKEGTVIEKDEGAKRTMKPPDKYLTDFENEECKLQIDSARIDVKNGRLVFEDNIGGWTLFNNSDKEQIACFCQDGKPKLMNIGI
jgi:hypothetical protein